MMTDEEEVPAGANGAHRCPQEDGALLGGRVDVGDDHEIEGIPAAEEIADVCQDGGDAQPLRGPRGARALRRYRRPVDGGDRPPVPGKPEAVAPLPGAEV